MIKYNLTGVIAAGEIRIAGQKRSNKTGKEDLKEEVGSNQDGHQCGLK